MPAPNGIAGAAATVAPAAARLGIDPAATAAVALAVSIVVVLLLRPTRQHAPRAKGSDAFDR